MTSSNGSGAAFDAGVDTTRPPAQQAYLEAIADDREAAVAAIEEKLAGVQESLKTAKADAKAARAEAGKGGAE